MNWSVGGASDTSAPAKLVIADATMSPRVAPLWAAHESGFFTRNGIDAAKEDSDEKSGEDY